MVALIIVIAIVLLIIVYGVSTYNSFIKLRNQAESASASIDVHLKERYDLVPNLVECVKGYAKHESSTLEAVISARNRAVSATNEEEKNEANKLLSSSLKSLFALAEAYPDLKANASFLQLQQKLGDIESGLLNARKYYNAIVRDFNTKRETFPSSIIASISHFKALSYAEVEDEAKARVEVKF